MSPDEINPKGVNPAEAPKGKGAPGQADRSQFESYMNQPPKTPPPGVSDTGQPQEITPLEIAKIGQQPASAPTLNSLLAQANTVQGFSEELQKQLQTPKLRFKKSQQYLLRNKLSEANVHITAAANKIGANIIPLKNPPAGVGPVDRFIQFVSHGEEQLIEAKNTLTDMSKNPTEALKPADLLLVQVKLAQAQQELEYASILLSKLIDVLKQTINIQL